MYTYILFNLYVLVLKHFIRFFNYHSKAKFLFVGVFADSIAPKEEGINKTRRGGESVTLSCTYKSKTNVLLYWYRQYPNKEPQYLFCKSSRSSGGVNVSAKRYKLTTSPKLFFSL